MKIGFIGLGRMGAGMARNLMRAGHQLIVYNRTLEKTRPFASEGAQVAASPADAAREAKAVFTMLSEDQAVSATVFGKDGIASSLRSGAAHISSSTISTALARKLTGTHRERDQLYLSAPVFGRPEAAEAKKLIVVPAGDPDVIERFRPLLGAIGRATFVAGTEPWQANLIKLCGNFMIASMLEAFAESFATVEKAGIQRQLFLQVISELFDSPVYKNYGAAVAEQRFQPAGFALKLGLKDVRLALEAAEELNVPLPMGSLIRDHLLSAMADDQAEWDWSSLALVSERSAGL
jgi:3-hydroxyisobutyrate dehydrogenase-like beta-hydroxyacid dehydrogenase